jgi:DNA-binding NtrC family response regulator
MRYGWSGNIRELENVVERAVIMASGEFITPDALPISLKNTISNADEQITKNFAGRPIKEVEKELIIKTLERTDKNITRAAELLGISRRTLHNKINEYNIEM